MGALLRVEVCRKQITANKVKRNGMRGAMALSWQTQAQDQRIQEQPRMPGGTAGARPTKAVPYADF
ncbi:MAG: hypothetical protein LBR88_07945 [Zoogloeaceae bacterium]|jgi:hypothetical protein|nr:hypothetical protein [Zoogloeaceae bacterium]